MRNLFERLKPEHKEQVLEYYKDCPLTFDSLKEELVKNEYIGQLKYITAIDLELVCGKHNAFDCFDDE